jgi:serine/threonine protein kinase
VTRVVILIALAHIFNFSTLINFKAFARKLIRLAGRIRQTDIDNEVRAIKKLCQCKHSNIIQVLGFGQFEPEGVTYFIDMELCEISLQEYIEGRTVNDLIDWNTIRIRQEVHEHAYKILQQILNGLIYIHCFHEVHRDLSPNNGTSFSCRFLTLF